MSHGLIWIGMSLICIAAARARIIPYWLAVTVAVLGGLGPFAGTIGFLVEERRRRQKAVSGLPFKVLDGALASRSHLLGEDFTVADLNVAAVISRAIDMDLSATPRLAQWLSRCLERPAARTALALRAQADAATPVEVVQAIARYNRL